MNLEKLHQLQSENRAAQIYFRVLSGRYRASKQNTVQDVIDIARRADVMVSPAEVVAFFEGLEAADCGRLIHETDGQHFVWIVKANRIEGLLRPKKGAANEENAVPNPKIAAPDPVAMLSHPLRLRPDLLIELQLPADLSAGEGRRLCHFIRAIAPAENS